MKNVFLTILSVAAALLCAVSCDDIMEMVGDLGGENGGTEITSFSVTPAKLTIKAEGGEATIAFTAPDVWSATCSQDWITINPSAGKSGETIVTIAAAANETDKERSADVVVESAKFRASVQVTQAAGEGNGNGNGNGEGTTPSDSTATDVKWYVCGNFVEWQADKAMEMHPEGNGIFTLGIDVPTYAEFKFIQDKSWEVNLGATTKGDVGDNNSPAIKAEEVVNLIEGGYNLYFENGGTISIILDVNAKTAVIKGGNTNPPEPPQEEDAWSLIGTILGYNWDTDVEMNFDGTVWWKDLYIAEGEEFKIRNHKDWADNRGYGYFDPRNPYMGAIPDGDNIQVPYSGYWNVYYSPADEIIYLEENLIAARWEYFLNPRTGERAEVTFTQNWWGETAKAYIKYYEVHNGIRICRTETFYHEYNGSPYTGNGFFGVSENPDEYEWTFIWYTDSNLIQLPLQNIGYYHEKYGDYIWVYDQYAVARYLDYVENLPTWIEAATAGNYVSGYYDNNGGFYFNVEWYYITNQGGWHVASDDVVGEADGFDRHDYSVSCNSSITRSGYVPVKVTAGKDIVALNYVLVEGKLDDETALAQAQAILEGAVEPVLTTDYVFDEDKNKNIFDFKFYGEKSVYYTFVAVGYDAYGQDYWWIYWYFPVYAYDANRTWKSLGTGSYTDGFFSSLMGVDVLTWDVEVQQCVEDTSVIRLVYPYDSKYGINEDGDFATDRSYDIEINIPDNQHIYILPQDSGIDGWGFGMMCLMSDPGYDLALGRTIKECEDSGLQFGTLSEGIITFPTKGLLVNLPDYNYTGLYYANSNDAFKLVLPGYQDTTEPAAGAPAKVGRKSTPKAGWSVLRREEPANGKTFSTKKSLKSGRFSPMD